MPSVGTFASNIARMQALYTALGWGGELEGEHHASLSGVGGVGSWNGSSAAAAPCSPDPGLV